MSDEIYEVSSTTPNLHTELARQLEALAPEAIADGKVDIAKLKELLGDDVQDESERFGLFWPGKKRALRAAQAPTTATLRPDRDNSKDWDSTQNIFIEGDNLEVLKILQKHYHGKIKMIYIDPPYNTGKDFVYPDNYQEGLESYLEWTKQVNEEGKTLSTNAETDGRYHSNWLNMMYPRLKLARNLLKDDGVIFISIDDNEQSRLHILCDEIFGEANYVATITREAIRGGSVSKHMRTVHDYVLVYARKAADFGAGGIEQDGLPLDLIDAKGAYRIGRELNKWGAGSRRQDAPGMFFAVPGPNGEEVFPIRNDGSEGRWRLGRQKMSEKVAAGDVVFERRDDGTYVVYEKVREAGPKVKQFTTLFTGAYQNSRGAERLKELFGGTRSYFDYAKPCELIMDLVQLANLEDGDLVMDFFAGSGTTADAVMQANAADGIDRKWLLVQLPEPLESDSLAREDGYETISSLTRKRIELAAEKIKNGLQGQLGLASERLDFGFKSFNLTDSNFVKWHVSSDVEQDLLAQTLLDFRDKSAKTGSESVLTELLLKQGFSLATDVSVVELVDIKFYSVGQGVLLAYLDSNVKPTLDNLRAILDLSPARLLILEDSFQGDDELKTNLKQICATKNIEFWTA